MSGIGIIANPHSKLNKRNPSRRKLLAYILGEKGRFEVTNSLEEVTRVVQDFREKGVDVIAINGGDGTVSRTLTAIIQAFGQDTLPAIALLRGGTMNVVASCLGIKGLPEQILYRLLESHSATKPLKKQKLQTLFVNNEHYGFLFANGVAPSFLEEFYRKKTGTFGVLKLLTKMIGSWAIGKGLYYRMVQEHECWFEGDAPVEGPHQSCGVFCSSIDRLPLGIRIFPYARKKKGQFQCISVAMQARKLVWKIPRLLLEKKPRKGSGKISFVSSGVSIEYQGGRDYTLDGELYLSKTDQISVRLGPVMDFIVV